MKIWWKYVPIHSPGGDKVFRGDQLTRPKDPQEL